MYPGVAGAYTPQFTPQTLGGSPLSGILNSGISGLFGPQMQRQPQVPFGVDPVTAAIVQQAQYAQQLQLQPYQTAGINRLVPFVDPITAACVQQVQLAQLIQLIHHQQQQLQQQLGLQQFGQSPFGQSPFGQIPLGQSLFGQTPWGQTNWLGGPGIQAGRGFGFTGIPGY